MSNDSKITPIVTVEGEINPSGNGFVSTKKIYRALTDEEKYVYGAAATEATIILRTFYNAVSLLRPFIDETAKTTYVDRYARVGIPPVFFTWTPKKRATAILHEAMHVQFGHFNRFEAHGIGGQTANIAGDLEIGSIMDRVPRTDNTGHCVPERGVFKDYPLKHTMEQYSNLLKTKLPPQLQGADGQLPASAGGSQQGQGMPGNQGQGQGAPGQGEGTPGQGDASGQGEGSGSGNSAPQNDPFTPDPSGPTTPEQIYGSSCQLPNSQKEDEIDQAGVGRASDTEVAQARESTRHAIEKELRQRNSHSYSPSGEGDYLYEIFQRMTPPKVNWQKELSNAAASAFSEMTRGARDYTNSVRDRRVANSPFILPGMTDFRPTLCMGVDTSGSMGKEDIVKAISEAEAIIKRAASGSKLSIFSVDTSVKTNSVQTVRKASEIKFRGGGGTDMAPAFEYVTTLPKKKRPSVFILATDGYWYWDEVIEIMRNNKKNMKFIILITQKGGMKEVHRDASKYCRVIDISDSREEF